VSSPDENKRPNPDENKRPNPDEILNENKRPANTEGMVIVPFALILYPIMQTEYK
jgi:hypothetical protein